jgi:hypothetical protein
MWLDFNYSSTNYSANLTTDTSYGQKTMEEIAVDVAREMNKSASGFSCTYSTSTNKDTISRSTGTFILSFGTGTHCQGVGAASCAALLGFTPTTHAAALSFTSDFAVYKGRIAVASSVAFQFLWRSGASGGIPNAVSKNAAAVLGFSPYSDGVETPTPYTMEKWAVAPIAKTTRQQVFVTANNRYMRLTGVGPGRAALNVEAKYIQDTDTAVSLRNRLADLTTVPRIVVSASIEGVVGIERGEIIGFDSSMDPLRPYPDPDGTGSWVGRRFVVVETEQHLGPDSYFTEVVAVSIYLGDGYGSSPWGLSKWGS